MPIHKKRNGLHFPPDEIDKNAKLNSFVNFMNLIDIKLHNIIRASRLAKQ